GGNNTGGSNVGNPGGSGETRSHHTARRARSGVPPGNERRYIPDEIVAEIVGSTQQRNNLLNRFRLGLLETRSIPLLNTTFYRLRILDGSTVPAKIRALEGDGSVRTAQPNYLFVFARDGAQSGSEDSTQDGAQARPAAAETADAAQYALAKLRLGEAHALARGDKVSVAVIDSGIDADHPSLAGAVEKSFDALGSNEGPHSHGTAIAGIIA